jgi:putative intracellular protease/amidase
VFKDARAQITLVSPKGGRPPLDPNIQDPNFQTDITRRFAKDSDAERQLDKTARLESVRQEDYDNVFYPGGHGPMWDPAEDPNSIKLIEAFLGAGKPVALVCHAPGVLRHVKTPTHRNAPSHFTSFNPCCQGNPRSISRTMRRADSRSQRSYCRIFTTFYRN